MVAQVSADRRTRAELGSDFESIVECLWAQDCQRCGQPIGTAQPSSLAVDDFGAGMALVTLNHPACRAAEWSTAGPVTLAPSSSPTLSHVNQMHTMSTDDEDEIWAWMLTNPGLESVVVLRSDQGWQVSMVPYLDAGLDTELLRIGTPIPGAKARIQGNDVSITMTVTPFETYTVGASDRGIELVRRQGGLGWAVSYALLPGKSSPADLGRAMATGQVCTGWVQLAD